MIGHLSILDNDNDKRVAGPLQTDQSKWTGRVEETKDVQRLFTHPCACYTVVRRVRIAIANANYSQTQHIQYGTVPDNTNKTQLTQ